MKLNQLLESSNVTAYGFSAFKALESLNNDNKEGNIVIATDSPALMAGRGIRTYYSPSLPRGGRYNTADDVLAANLDVMLVQVHDASGIDNDDDVLIVSQHQGTVGILKNMYPNALVAVDITPEQIKGKCIVGTLGPDLLQHCDRFRLANIRNFDYKVDNDLVGDELKDRLLISGTYRISAQY